VDVDEIARPKRGGRALVRAARAEEMGELEHEGHEVDRDEEREEELDVLLHGGAGLLDALERRLAGEEVAVRLDRGDPVRDLAAPAAASVVSTPSDVEAAVIRGTEARTVGRGRHPAFLVLALLIRKGRAASRRRLALRRVAR